MWAHTGRRGGLGYLLLPRQPGKQKEVTRSWFWPLMFMRHVGNWSKQIWATAALHRYERRGGTTRSTSAPCWALKWIHISNYRPERRAEHRSLWPSLLSVSLCSSRCQICKKLPPCIRRAARARDKQASGDILLTCGRRRCHSFTSKGLKDKAHRFHALLCI